MMMGGVLVVQRALAPDSLADQVAVPLVLVTVEDELDPRDVILRDVDVVAGDALHAERPREHEDPHRLRKVARRHTLVLGRTREGVPQDRPFHPHDGGLVPKAGRGLRGDCARRDQQEVGDSDRTKQFVNTP